MYGLNSKKVLLKNLRQPQTSDRNSQKRCAKITVMILQLAVVNVVCHSQLQSLAYCYARVIRETCNTSAADINVLKTVIYNLKYSGYLTKPCPLGKSQITTQLTLIGSSCYHWRESALFVPTSLCNGNSIKHIFDCYIMNYYLCLQQADLYAAAAMISTIVWRIKIITSVDWRGGRDCGYLCQQYYLPKEN